MRAADPSCTASAKTSRSKAISAIRTRDKPEPHPVSTVVILSEAKNLLSHAAQESRSFASLRMTFLMWYDTLPMTGWIYATNLRDTR